MEVSHELYVFINLGMFVSARLMEVAVIASAVKYVFFPEGRKKSKKK